MEGDVDANTIEGGTSEAEEGGGNISGALIVATPTLSKGASTVGKGATIALVEVANTLT